MKIRNLLKTLILFLTVAVATGTIYADEVEQTITLSVSPYVAVEKLPSSVEEGSVNPATGVIDKTLRAAYNISTNNTDADFDFTVTSSIITADGEVSAFGTNGCLLFANVTNPPTTVAVNNAKTGGSDNRNVMAYPTSTTITSPMTSTYTPNYGVYGDCYVIKVNDSTGPAEFNFIISPTPFGSTYNTAQEEAGSYKSTITLTVTPKI